jgi:hypothetical protein
MLDFVPAFDSSHVERMEHNAQKNATTAAIYRRLALVLLTKTVDALWTSVAKPKVAEKFLDNAECLRSAIEWHESQIDLLKAAEARISAALSEGAGVQSGELGHAAYSQETRRVAAEGGP